MKTEQNKNRKLKHFVEVMFTSYLECAAWADTPEYTESGLDFSPCAEESAISDCMRFAGINWELIKECQPEQVGHDFWLTRNHHGAGFWDRPEIYGGEDNAEELTKSAYSFGERCIFEHEGTLIIE